MLRLRSQSVRRYRVVGDLPSPYDAAFAERLRERRFRPLAPHEERSHGWVAAHNLLVTRFDVDTLVRGEHVAFALRIDQRRVPPRLLKAHLELELGARVDASAAAVPEGGRPARVGREERRALREEIHKRLLLETPPAHLPGTAASWSIVLLAIFPTVAAAFLTYALIARQGAGFFGQINLLVPLAGVFWGTLILAEKLPWNAWLALCVILGGIAVSRNWNANRKAVRPFHR